MRLAGQRPSLRYRRFSATSQQIHAAARRNSTSFSDGPPPAGYSFRTADDTGLTRRCWTHVMGWLHHAYQRRCRYSRAPHPHVRTPARQPAHLTGKRDRRDRCQSALPTGPTRARPETTGLATLPATPTSRGQTPLQQCNAAFFQRGTSSAELSSFFRRTPPPGRLATGRQGDSRLIHPRHGGAVERCQQRQHTITRRRVRRRRAGHSLRSNDGGSAHASRPRESGAGSPPGTGHAQHGIATTAELRSRVHRPPSSSE